VILSVYHLIYGSAHFSFQAQILALVHCACVPDINSAACNALINFSFSFSREVTDLILAPCPSQFHSVFCSGIAIFFVCRNWFRPSRLLFRSWVNGQSFPLHIML
jgi:hypothetical protein